jgi:PBP1b-binding outer membrane lipoprotein LpoB
VCIKTKAKKSVTITITIAIILFSCNAWGDYKFRYKDSIRSVEIENVERLENVKPLRTAIKSISVLSVELKNMYLSHVKADYVHLAGQKQQTNGLIESTIFF